MVQPKPHTAFEQALKALGSDSCRRPVSLKALGSFVLKASDSVSCRRPVSVGGPLGQASTERNIGVSLYPLTALALAACGGGGGGGGGSPIPEPADPTPTPTPTEPLTGRVFDGPVVGAQVYFDVNANGVQDDGDVPIGETDARGQFTISGEDLDEYGADTPLLVVLDGATDLGDDLDDPSDDREIDSGTWQAPADSSVISPLTDLLVRAEIDSDALAELLELPSDVDVTQYDPYDADTPDETALAVIEVAQEVAEILVDLDATDEEVTPDEIATVVERVVTSESPTEFTLNPVVTTLAEDADTGTRTQVATLAVTDADTESDAQTYLLSGDDKSLFEVDGATLYLRAGAAVDYERALELGGPSLDVTVKVVGTELTQTYTLAVTDVDDNAPTAIVFANVVDSLAENTATAMKLADITITDADGGNNAVTIPDSDIFELNSDGTELWLQAGAVLDYETASEHTITLQATTDGVDVDGVTQTFTLAVTDVDDNAPTAIVFANAVNSLAENSATAMKLADITLTDADVGNNGVTIPDSDIFELRNNGTELWLKENAGLDFETATEHTITLQATTDGVNVDGLTQTFTLSLTDVDEAPTAFRLVDPNDNNIAKASATLAEDVVIPPNPTTGGIKLADITFTDDALGTNAVTIVPGTNPSDIFELRNSDTELWLRHNAVLDYETPPNSYTVRLQATTNTALTQDFMLTVTDVDEPPTAFRLVDPNDNNIEKASATLAEDVVILPDPTTGGIKLADITFTDDALGTNAVTIVPSTNPSDIFELRNSDTELWLKAGAVLDYETTPNSYTVRLQATTNTALTQTFTLSVTDVDEAPTAFRLVDPTDNNIEKASATLAEDVVIPPDPINPSDPPGGIKLADITFEDDALGTNAVTIVGTNNIFELRNNNTELWLRHDAVLDYETTPNSYTVRLQATTNTALTQDFMLTVADVDEAPTAFRLVDPTDNNIEKASATLAEDVVIPPNPTTGGIKLADITFTDDALGTNAVTIVPGTNPSDIFELRNSNTELWLRHDAVLDYETTPNSYTVRLQATTNTALTQEFMLTVTDVDDAPTAFRLVDPTDNNIEKASATLAEDVDIPPDPINPSDPPGGIKLADITFTDDALGTNAVTIVPSTNPNNIFELRNSDTELWLRHDAVLDYETTPNSYTVRLQATTNTALTRDFTLTVTDVDEAPTAFVLTNVVNRLAEDAAAQKLADITLTDEDGGNNGVTIPDNAVFEIRTPTTTPASGGGIELWLKADALDYETPPNIHGITLQATTDGADVTINGVDLTKLFTLTVTDVNEKPVIDDISTQTQSLTLEEGTTTYSAPDNSDRETGYTFTATDEDVGDIVTFSVDDDRFEIVDGKLLVKTGQVFDYEATANPSGEITLTITATDDDGTTPLTSDPVEVTITVLDVASDPTITVVDNTQTLTLNEGTTAATLSDTEAATGYTFTATAEDGSATTLSVEDDRFEIVSGALRIKTEQVFDFETENPLTVVVTATDANRRATSTSVTITITDVDEAPTAFRLVDPNDNNIEKASATLAEDVVIPPDPINPSDPPGGIKLADITFTDDALGTNAVRIVGTNNIFVLRNSNTELWLRHDAVLDYETTPNSYTVTLQATWENGGSQMDVTTNGVNLRQTFTLTVTDVDEPPTAFRLVDPNDNAAPKASATLAEDVVILPDPTTGGIKLADITFTDDALGTNAVTIVTGTNPSDIFELRNSDTELWLRHDAVLDYETTPNSYTVRLQATTNTALTQEFMLTVTDVDDAPTAFRLVDPTDNNIEKASATLAEDVDIPPDPINPSDPPGGIKLADITFTDDALGTNAVTIVPSTNPSNIFELRTSSDGDTELWLRHDAVLDYETTPNSYTVRLQATTNTALTQTFTLTVTDVNEKPVIDDISTQAQTLTLNEGTTAYSAADNSDRETGYTFTAPDEDAGDIVTFTIASTGRTVDDRFEIVDGKLLVKTGQVFDFEDANNPSGEITLTITATDDDGTTPLTSDPVEVTITVTDVNEAPVLEVSGTGAVNEGTYTDETATGYIFSATDEDVGDTVTYSVTGDDRFSISNSGVLNIVGGSSFDYETSTDRSIALTITATDNDGTSSNSLTVTIEITDVNEAPVLSPSRPGTQVLPEGTYGMDGTTTATAYTFTATDEDDGDTLMFTITGADDSVDTRFSISTNQEDGISSLDIAPNSVFDFETEPTFTLTITATDDDGTNPLTSEPLEVLITITDVDDAPTAFRLVDPTDNNIEKVTATLDEIALTTKTKLTRLNVKDVDTDITAQMFSLVRHSLLSEDDDLALFETGFEDVGGEMQAFLYLKAGITVDFETNPMLGVRVGLVGSSLPALNFSVTVRDVTSASGSQMLTLNEGTTAPLLTSAQRETGYTITTTATGATFMVSDDRFELDGDKLLVKTGQVFDYEATTNPSGEVIVFVTATDADGAMTRARVPIEITNVAPVLTVSTTQTLTLDEGRYDEDTIITYTDGGTQTEYTVTATDVGGDDTVTFTITRTGTNVVDTRFKIVDGKLVIAAGSSFDHETESPIILTITASDGELTDMATVDIAVADLVDFAYYGIAAGIGRAVAVVPGDEAGAVKTTASFEVATHETATYAASDFTVYEQNADGDYVVSTRFDVIQSADVASEFVLTLLAGNALPSPTTTNVRVEATNAIAGDAVPTYLQVVTAEHTLREYGLERDTLTGTVILPGVTSVDDITVAMGRASYIHGFAISDAFGELTFEIVNTATGEVSWTYKLDHNGPGLNYRFVDGLVSEIFALSGGGTTQHVAVNVETLWNSYLYNQASWAPYTLTDENKDDDNTVIGSLGGTDLIKGFGGDDAIWGYGGNDVLIGGAGNDTIYVGTHAPGSSTVIYRFESEGRTAKATDGTDTIVQFELGVDRLMLIDTDEDTPITDVAGLIELIKLRAPTPGALSPHLSSSSDNSAWTGIGFTFERHADGRDNNELRSDGLGGSPVNQGRALTIDFHEELSDAEIEAFFHGGTAPTAGTYISQRVGAPRGELTEAAIDALGTFFGDSLLVVDTDVDLDIF